MVEIGGENKEFFSSTLYPHQEIRFLPEEEIVSEKELRADYEKLSKRCWTGHEFGKLSYGGRLIRWG